MLRPAAPGQRLDGAADASLRCTAPDPIRAEVGVALQVRALSRFFRGHVEHDLPEPAACLHRAMRLGRL